MTSKLSRWLGKPSPAWYLAIVLLALAATLVAKVRIWGVFACPAAYGGAAYLSDCSATKYGDYDHGAFWYGLEPAARRSASRAKVIVLGSSRIQFAMSTPATTQWFGERAIPFYLLGFSHYESVTFVTPVLARVQPESRAYVINADRFFAEHLSPTSERILQEGDARARYSEKRFWQRLHEPLCGSAPSLCGNNFAVYRTVANGAWFTAGTAPDEPRKVSDGVAAEQERWPHFIDLARQFVDRLGVDRKCVVLTIVPYSGTKRAEAQAIAQALGAAFIAPRIDDLTMFDGSHLDARSAQRWSQAFLGEAGPTLEQCAAGRAGVVDAESRERRP